MEILKEKTVQDAWETLKGEIIKAKNKTIPQRKKNKRHLTRPARMHTELSDKLRDINIKKQKQKRGS